MCRAVKVTDRALVTCLTLKLGSYAVVTYLAYIPEVLKHTKTLKKTHESSFGT